MSYKWALGLFFMATISGCQQTEENIEFPSKIHKSGIAGVKMANERGAADVYILSETVFNSIKLNDYGMIYGFLPNDEEIEYLRQTSSEKNKYQFESLTNEILDANTRLNFERLYQQGMVKHINWSEVEIQESKLTTCKLGDQKICQAVMTVQDSREEPIKISFDMIKIKNRWFLYQGIRLINEKASAKNE